jgi:hypothetical protein
MEEERMKEEEKLRRSGSQISLPLSQQTRVTKKIPSPDMSMTQTRQLPRLPRDVIVYRLFTYLTRGEKLTLAASHVSREWHEWAAQDLRNHVHELRLIIRSSKDSGLVRAEEQVVSAQEHHIYVDHRLGDKAETDERRAAWPLPMLSTHP